MTFTELAFSTEGRINRVTFWKTAVVFALLAWIGYLLVSAPDNVAAFAGWMILAALLWPITAMLAKRWHDLDHSAWWSLTILIPVIGQLGNLCVLGFLQGTSGPNRFGYPMDADRKRGHTHRGSRPRTDPHPRPPRHLPASYPDLMAMFAKLAKCDGPITAAEIGAVDQFLNEELSLSDAARKEAIRNFRAARDSRMSFEEHVRRFRDHHAEQQHFLARTIDMLVALALADGRLRRREALFLDLVVAVFGVSSQRYYECKYGDSGPRVENTTVPEEKEYARILGLTGRVSREDIRRAYRGLVGQYHPDKVSHLGSRLREVADQEIKKINEAYEYFRKKYDL